MKIIAIIPARGGSLRIRDKNIKNFAGKPLIAWTILEAKKSELINKIIVATDSPEISMIAKKYGAETPFLLPDSLTQPSSSIEPVIKYAYEWLIKNQNFKADAVVLLMPPNPLRKSVFIDEAIKIFKKKKPDSVVAVSETPANHTPFWTLIKQKSGKVTLFNGQNIKKIIRISQNFPQKCYGRNDLVYVLKPRNLFEKNSNLYGDKVELYVTNPLYEADINTPEEWLMTEMKFKMLRSIKK
ncbi:MAG: CMP-N-acetylneuraminic acid synthetase [Candidatus Azambacteria bacterium GW2011_GWA2_39_10]|uniref:CMP-N-acetylneuraminic acid synthetase n=1 Tax=Candidatus Azambacteria bacterium GW2011_GWA2_39_10 TaxID=1618611 RepID=A0A0G0PNW5_9BACT|nr:MAG: CMP-N-acetylneuraminic acid synthetase [Candidatus Azambacteria bacterium GW2011_GWA2_39_10]